MSNISDTAILHRAVKMGSKQDILQILQRKKFVLNTLYGNSNTVLHTLFQNQNLSEKDTVQILKTLLDLGFDPNIKNNEELSALHFAVAKRSRDAVDILLKRKAKIDVIDLSGNTIVHFFVEHESQNMTGFSKIEVNPFRRLNNEEDRLQRESVSFMEWLISKGFGIDRKNARGSTALLVSVNYSLHHISLVLSKHARIIRYEDEPSHNRTLIHLVLQKHAPINNTQREIYNEYHAYSSYYVPKIVEILIDRIVAVAPNDLCKEPSIISAAINWTEDTNIVNTMIQHLLKIRPQSHLKTIILLELFNSIHRWGKSRIGYFLETSNDLIKQGADIDAKDIKGNTPIYLAFNAQNVQAINFLKKHGADFSVINNAGNNLLHALATWILHGKDQQILFDLIAKKGCCDVNEINESKETPLFIAIRYNNDRILQKLVKSGAKINCQNSSGETPLHFAAWFDRSGKIADFLLQNGANINAKDHQGQRPLHLAVSKNNLVLLLLLKWGACVNVYAGNKSPFSLAIESECVDNMKDILAYGADINHAHIVSLIKKLSPQSHSRRMILQHWVKLSTAKLPCMKEYQAYAMADKYQQFYEVCLKEIETLKSTLIDNSTSIYTYLHMDVASKRIHLNNEKLKQFLDSPNLEKQFPQYYILILASYNETKLWKSLLEPAKKTWLQLTNIALPDICIEQIFVHLKNEDLVSMME